MPSLPIVWDFGEGDPTSGRSGGWEQCLGWLLTVLEQETKGLISAGKVEHASAAAYSLPDDAAQVIATDPPYYDAVPYADLSDFFYVWLKRTVGDRHPNLFTDELTPKDDECVVDEIKGHDKAYFERVMGQAMGESCRVVNPNGIGIVVFAHKSTAGWEAQMQAIIGAGWTITGSWPIDTEMGTRLRAMDSAALASSIHLVCRPRKNPSGSLRINDIGDWRDVLHELPGRIHEWMPRLSTEGVVGADAIFACLGPALEIFSRYSRVERADGEQVTLKEYLEYVWAAVSREALDMIFQGADTSGFEPDARLTAMWLWTLSTSNIDGSNGQRNGKTVLFEDEGEEDEEEVNSPKKVASGYSLEFDAARKIAQGLGAHLEKLHSLVEIKGSTARLRAVTERGRFLFDKEADGVRITKSHKKERVQQLTMFSVQELAEELDGESDLPA